MVEKIYTDEMILEQLREHYKRNPNISSSTFKADKSVCSLTTVKLRFGLWETALKKAGIPLKKEMTKEDIIQQLKEFYNKNGKITKDSLSKDKIYCSPERVVKVFGSWDRGLVESGLKKPKKYIEYDKEKLLEVLKEKVKSGELKYRTDINNLEGVPSWTYVRQLWSWNKLVKILKLKRRVYAYTDNEIINIYKKLKKKNIKIKK